MAKNYMKEVANLLGVELEEEFIIKDEEDYVYKFTRSFLVVRPYDKKEWFKSDLLVELLNGTYKIEKPILDKQEKEYLSAVIKPFRDRVVYIKKKSGCLYEYLLMLIKLDDGNNEYVSLPRFNKGTMYKGMEANKEYTLEELGL